MASAGVVQSGFMEMSSVNNGVPHRRGGWKGDGVWAQRPSSAQARAGCNCQQQALQRQSMGAHDERRTQVHRSACGPRKLAIGC